MKTVCAWCHVTISESGAGSEVSHGICPKCTVEQLAMHVELERQIGELVQPALEPEGVEAFAA
jgi:hypothetical protein